MRGLLFIVFFFIVNVSWGSNKKSLQILRTDHPIEIDGILNEPAWNTSLKAANFIQNTPKAGEPSLRETEVSVTYNDQAIFVGATLFDQRDSVTKTLSQRDDFGNADWFGVVIDPYNAGTIGFAFLVTSAGVQIDELHQPAGVDNNWNAVWQSAVSFEEDRWFLEFRIPFSAIRFSDQNLDTWGITFARNIRRHREQSYWNFYDPTGINLISQLGELKGLEEINSPVRLSFTPYVSGYVEKIGDVDELNYSLNGGMDVKYGINDAFTVDMTLIPDFGQVQFDNQVLNLSPFEVQFNERRQFFTEGTELFNKRGVFYSRRIGGTPINIGKVYEGLDSTEIVTENPPSAQLLNATKLSGRTKKGTGIGFFNAISGIEHALIFDTITGEERSVETSPLTNYNVLVIDQNLKNNSSITFTNTNVWRSGYTYDANVLSLGTNLLTKNLKYNLFGGVNLSQKFFQDSVGKGYQYNFGFGKATGNFLWAADYSEIGSDYDPNDLGFLTIRNIRTGNAGIEYNIYKPFWRLYRMWSSFNMTYERIIDPNEFAGLSLSGSVNGTFRNFMTAGVNIYAEPIKNRDWFEPRVAGRFYEKDEQVRLGGFISSDYSKPFALDMTGNASWFNEVGRWLFNLEVSPRFRFSDKFFVVYTAGTSYAIREEGAALTYDFELPFEGGDPMFSIRDRFTFTNTINADYIFTNRMGLTFRLRHYWSKVTYKDFFVLNEQGQFNETTYSGEDDLGNSLHNNNYDAFTIDMVYRWVFAPGSEMTLVWKNSIFSFSQAVENNYVENINALVQNNPATNGLSLKIIYYIDYWQVSQSFKKL